MLIRALEQGAKTDEEYRHKMISGIKIDIVVCAVGIATIVVAVLWAIIGNGLRGSFLSGVFAGTGAAILFFGIKHIWKAKKLIKDEKLLRAERLKASDERNHMITQKSMYWSGIIVAGICYIVMLVSGFFNMAVFWSTWAVVMVYSVLSVILKKYYEKKL
ncbi:MAG: hypothetical protein H2212_13505 [Ruminococcus sp.]|nr:hypothetical protein [Ruminococcus sp.]